MVIFGVAIYIFLHYYYFCLYFDKHYHNYCYDHISIFMLYLELK